LLRPEDGEDGADGEDRADVEDGARRVAVISYRTWQREFGGDSAVLGRRLIQTQSQDSYSIVGVAPAGLDYPVGADYWIPARSRDAVTVVARLAPDVPAETAGAELLSFAQKLEDGRSNPRAPTEAAARSLSEAVVGDAKPILVAIIAAVVLLLLITCANVGNLLLMRTTQRSTAVIVRRALGATTGQIARLFLVEGALLAAAGGALGLALAVALLRILPGFAPGVVPRMDVIAFSGMPIALAIGVTVLALLLIGVAPALAAARGDFASALRTNSRSSTGTRGRRRVRQLFVATQVALAVVLLFGAGLLVRSLQRLGDLELGYDTESVVVVELGFNRQAAEGPAETFALLDGVLERMRAVPGVTAATPIMARPFMGSTGIFRTRPMSERQSESDAEANIEVPLEVGGGELFRTLGIPIIRGRRLLDTDRDGAPRVAVVSEAVAEHMWPDEDPIGKRIHLVTSEAQWWTVVGVAGDTRFRELRESTPTIYLHFRQLQILPGVWTVALRTGEHPATVLPTMRRLVNELDPRVSVWRAGTLGDHLSRGPLARPRMSAALLSGFGLAALLLAAAGLYGVMALAVRERTHELGVRKALGASPARLRRDVLGEAAAVTAVGTMVGLLAALFVSRLLVTLLFDVAPADPATLLGVCAMLLLVAVVAAYPAARRATRVEPMRALKSE
ncbi:MAG TPA: FtsX-like permease family protein, partial [Longimicrobiales bacterium]|nr:FtsX-like permease family protein [Longimicrobiales bacterium]